MKFPILNKKSYLFRLICAVLVFVLIQGHLENLQAQGTAFVALPKNYFLAPSPAYSLPVLRGIRVYPDKPFEFDFMVGSEDSRVIDRAQSRLLIKYFLTCLTIPQEDLWVNLSPYEKDRIIPDALALTDAGNALLEQDKMLKQLAASLTYPESKTGSQFWAQVYAKAYQRFGTTDLPVNTYNKVWIVPDKAVVYDMGHSALIGATHLKVMLEEDYLALKKHTFRAKPKDDVGHQISLAITKEIILPQLEKEINQGRNFAPVRQIFHSMLLAAWFKNTLKRHVLNDFYVDKKKIAGIDGISQASKKAIYRQYLRIYKVGAYNYIREDVNPISQQITPRKYFSGGVAFGKVSNAMLTFQVPDARVLLPVFDKAQLFGEGDGNENLVTARLTGIGINLKESERILYHAIKVDAAQRAYWKQIFVTLSLLIGFAVANSANASVDFTPIDGQGLAVGMHRAGFHGQDLWNNVDAVGRYLHLDSKNTVHKKITYHIPSPAELKQWVNNDSHSSSLVKSRGFQSQIQTVSQSPSLTVHRLIFTPSFSAQDLVDNFLLTYIQNSSAKSITAGSAGSPPNESSSLTGPSQLPVTSTPVPVGINDPHVFFQTYPQVILKPIPETVLAPVAGVLTNFNISNNQVHVNILPQDLDTKMRIAQGVLKNAQDLNTSSNFVAGLERLKRRLNAEAQQRALENLEIEAGANRIGAKAITVTGHNQILRIDSFVPKGTFLYTGYRQDYFRIELEVPRMFKYANIALDLHGNGKSLSVVNPYVLWQDHPSDSAKAILTVLLESKELRTGDLLTADLRMTSRENHLLELNNVQEYIASAVTVPSNALSYSYPLTGSWDRVSFVGKHVVFNTPLMVNSQAKHIYDDQEKRLKILIDEIKEKLNKITEDRNSGNATVVNAESTQLRDELVRLETAYHEIQISKNLTVLRSASEGWVSSVSSVSGGKQGENSITVIPRIKEIPNVKVPQGVKRGDPVRVVYKSAFGDINLTGIVTLLMPKSYKEGEAGNVDLADILVDDSENFLGNDDLENTVGGDHVKVNVVFPHDAKVKKSLAKFVSPALKEAFGESVDRAMRADRRRFIKNFFVLVLAPAIEGCTSLLQTKPQKAILEFTPIQLQSPLLSLSDLPDLIFNNTLSALGEYVQTLKDHRLEDLPGALSVHLSANAYMQNGKILVGGGIQALWNGIAAGLSSGNALGALIPLIVSLSGNLVDWITDKIGSQEALAVMATEVSKNYLVAAKYRDLTLASDDLIDLGATLKRLDQLRALLEDLKGMQKEIIKAVNEGERTVHDKNAGEAKINAVEAEISSLEMTRDRLRIALHEKIGSPIEKFRDSIGMEEPSLDSYRDISVAEQQKKYRELISANSRNPRIQGSRIAYKMAVLALKLAQEKNLPKLIMNSFFASQNPSGSVVDIANGSLLRTSDFVEGPNSVGNLKIALVDQALDIKEYLASLDLAKMKLTQEDIQRQEVAAYWIKVAERNSLSRQIVDAKRYTQDAWNAWQTMLRDTNLHIPFDSENLHIAWDQKRKEEINLQAKFLKAQARLDEILGEHTFKPNLDAAQLAGSLKKSLLMGAVLVQGLMAHAGAVETSNHDNPIIQSILAQRGLYANGASELVKQALNEDSKPSHQIGLEALFALYPTQDSLMEGILLKAKRDNADVVAAILRHRLQQKNVDLVFFFRLMVTAEEQKNYWLEEMARQFLADSIKVDPQALKSLSSNSFWGITDEVLQQQVLTLLLHADAWARDNFFQNFYWTVDDWKKMYARLEFYLQQNPDVAKKKDCEDLLSNLRTVIERKQLAAHQNQIFNLGRLWGEHPIIPHDLLLESYFKQEALEFAKFVNRSPDGIPDAIDPRLRGSVGPVIQHSNGSAKLIGPLIGTENMILPKDMTADFDALPELAKPSSISTLDVPALARILDSDSPYAGLALERLMETYEGRISALKVLVDTTRETIVGLIAGAQFETSVLYDIDRARTPAELRILRQGFKKINNVTGAGWTGIRARTYTLFELPYAAKELDAKLFLAEIKLRTTGFALDAYVDEMGAWEAVRFHRTQETLSADQDTFLEAIKEALRRVKNPEDFQLETFPWRYSSDVEETRQDLIAIRNEYQERMLRNQQLIPFAPLSWMATGAAILSYFVYKVFRGLYRIFRLRQIKKDTVDYILYLAEKLSKLEQMEDPKNIEDDEPKRDMVETGSGTKIINLPKPQHADSRMKGALQNWHDLLSEWNKNHVLTSQAIVDQFHRMTQLALDSLRTIPLTAAMIESPSTPLQKTLFYRLTMTNYSLYSLRQKLSHKDISLTDQQAGQLNQDIDQLTDSLVVTVPLTIVFHCLANIQRVLARVLPKDHRYEKSELYRLARSFLGFEGLKKKSIQMIEVKAMEIVEQWFTLFGVEVDSNKQLVDSINKIINDRIAEAGVRGMPQAQMTAIVDKEGNFWREIKYPFQTAVLIGTVFFLLFHYPSASYEISLGGGLSIFYSWYWYYKPNLDFMDLQWGQDVIDLANKQKIDLKTRIESITEDVRTVVDTAMLGRHSVHASNGGIDLNFQPQFVRRGAGADEDIWENGGMEAVRARFKGFSFDIVRFRPNLTVHGAFQLMFNLP